MFFYVFVYFKKIKLFKEWKYFNGNNGDRERHLQLENVNRGISHREVKKSEPYKKVLTTSCDSGGGNGRSTQPQQGGCVAECSFASCRPHAGCPPPPPLALLFFAFFLLFFSFLCIHIYAYVFVRVFCVLLVCVKVKQAKSVYFLLFFSYPTLLHNPSKCQPWGFIFRHLPHFSS